MANSWDVYILGTNGGNLTLAANDTPFFTGVSVTDASNAGSPTITDGDGVDDSAGNTGQDFIGEITLNGVTGYVVNNQPPPATAFYILYVPAGDNPSTGTEQDFPLAGLSNSSIWTLDACFVTGTMIATPDGYRAVEDLARGDLVLTVDGSAKPIRWVGRSIKSVLFTNPAMLPVRIKAGALGENLPVRDLLVSPGHSMLLDGALVLAGALVNGTSIVRETGMKGEFTYFHVETDGHDILLAEGAATESFLAGVEDIKFDNWADRPADVGMAAELAYPRVKSARQMPRALRDLLAARAAEVAPAVAVAA